MTCSNARGILPAISNSRVAEIEGGLDTESVQHLGRGFEGQGGHSYTPGEAATFPSSEFPRGARGLPNFLSNWKLEGRVLLVGEAGT